MRFEVEVFEDKDTGEWVATAVEHPVTARGRTEKEALAILMEKLGAHFKKQS